MTFFDPKEEVLDIQLTQYGRHLLSKGKLRPSYYAFFDETVLYDANYGGVAESKNSAETRIQDETPLMHTQVGFTGRDEYLFDDTNDEEERQLIAAYEKLNVLTYPLGTTTFDSTKTPAFNIQFLEGEIKNLENNLSGTAASGKIKSRSHQLIKIPQIKTDVEFRVTTYDPSNPKVPFVADPELSTETVYADGLQVAVGPEQILLLVDEKNAPFEYENFDIEVFEITDETGPLNEKVLRPLSFLKPVEMVKNNLLIDQEEAEEMAGRIGGQAPEIDRTYVQYYFDVNVDEEVDEFVICRAISSLKSQNILVDSPVICPDITDPVRPNIYFSDAEDDECLDNQT